MLRACLVLVLLFAAAPALAQPLGQGLAGLVPIDPDEPTVSGEGYDPARMTAAHPSFPVGTMLRLENPANGRVVVVRVNDHRVGTGHALSLSTAALAYLGLGESGVVRWSSARSLLALRSPHQDR